MDFIPQIEVCRDDMKLKDICEINPRMQKIDDSTEVSFVSMPSVSEDGKIDITDIRRYSDVKKGYTTFKENDVLFAKITPCMENGKGAIARGLRNGYGCGSSEFHVLRSNDKAMPEWIYCLTSWQRFRKKAEKHMTGSAGQRRVPKQYLENYEIRLPELKVQAQQVETLMHLRSIIDHRITEVRSFDELIKARFVELFGDSLKGDRKPLSEVATITGGLTKNSSRNTFETKMPYLRVANVFYNRLDLREILEIGVKEEEIEKTLLKAGDLLFVEGNGSIEQIGRVAIWDGSIDPMLHQNHLIKARFNNEIITPEYALFYFMLQDGRQQIISKSVSTSGLNTLSVNKVSGLLLPIPPIALQKQFGEFIKRAGKSKF